VGYTGGDKTNPTYYSLGGHSEAIQIDYDPAVISYETLLGLFWASHNPSSPAYSRQYEAAVFYHDAEQERLAAESINHLIEQGTAVQTRLRPLSEFYLAEDYHQKYGLQNTPPINQEIASLYPNWRDLTDSTLAARLNAYYGGSGFRDVLEDEIDSYGLSDEARADLLEQAQYLPLSTDTDLFGVSGFCLTPIAAK
jgi:peptide-methionine (S)-S-oxide reductase